MLIRGNTYTTATFWICLDRCQIEPLDNTDSTDYWCSELSPTGSLIQAGRVSTEDLARAIWPDSTSNEGQP